MDLTGELKWRRAGDKAQRTVGRRPHQRRKSRRMIDNFALFITHLALLILGFRLIAWGDPEDGGSTDFAPKRAASDRKDAPLAAAPEGAAQRAAAARLRFRRFNRRSPRNGSVG